MENFKTILEKIKQEEYSLRDIKIEKTSNPNKSTITGADADKNYEYAHVVSFLLLAKYSNAFDMKDVSDVADISILLSQSTNIKANKFLKLWNEIADNYNYPYILDFIDILNLYDFSDYCLNDSNDVVISDFLNEKYLFNEHEYFLYDDPTVSTAFDIVDSCAFQLGIEHNDSDTILVSVKNIYAIRNILKKHRNKKLVFSKCGRLKLDIKIAIEFLSCYKDCQYVEEENDKFFPFDTAQFDGIYYSHYSYANSKESPESLEKLMEFVKKDGFCVACNQLADRVSNIFLKCEIPLVLEFGGYDQPLMIVAKNKPDETERVRYGTFRIENLYDESEFESWKNRLVSVIKNNGYIDYCYQVLSKDDFRYATKDIRFYSIKRAKDEMSFVWRDLKNIISRTDIEEIINNDDAEINNVIRFGDLSSNPFQIKADQCKYIKPFNNTIPCPNQIIKDFDIEKYGDYALGFCVPSKYQDIFYKTFDDDNNNDDIEARKFRKLLCYRLVTKPSILLGFNNVLRVEASPSHPVCIEKLYFYRDSYRWGCSEQIKTIQISPDYDENFIIYQIIKANHNGHILVAPTKEEQRTYFLNKRLEYLSTYQTVVDEMEDETKHAIAISDSRISGIGFKNFRRFIDLDLLSLSGVNILVGGNNAGKSTFVKGLLLSLDNIKSLVPENTSNFSANQRLYFQLDANKLHDVHVGTFNRAYSANAVPFDEDDYRKICFKARISHYVIDIIICPEGNDDITSIPIGKISVNDEKRNALFVFDYIHDSVTMTYELSSTKDTKIFHMLPFNTDNYYKTNVIASLIRGISDFISSNNQDESNDDWTNLQVLKGKTGFLIEISNELDGILNNTQVEYIYAHGINQKILFNYNDRNDFMAITLHDLINENISSEEEKFIYYWMEEFGIGKKFEINSIGGEAYSIQIKNMNDNIVYLADMGMGASQLLILIFRLAIVIHRQKMKGNTPYKPTIIIEEPEQNMHPAYQSKLAELFYKVYDKYGLNFIVETHSEYIVRKSQVIVAKHKFDSQKSLDDNNPFKVYYFPTEGNPYEMKYRADGNFSNEFGSGFYDEANNLLYEIL